MTCAKTVKQPWHLLCCRKVSESAHGLTTRPLFEWKELTQMRDEKKKKKKKASHMADMYPQLLLKHLSNYRISCSSQNLTLSGRWLCVCWDVLLYKCLIYWKANKQQLQNDLSSEFQGYTLFFWNTPSNWLWTLSDTHNRTDGFLQMARLHAEAGYVGCEGGPKALYGNKSLFLVSSKTPTCGWWDYAHILAAVNPSDRHGNTELTQTMT